MPAKSTPPMTARQALANLAEQCKTRSGSLTLTLGQTAAKMVLARIPGLQTKHRVRITHTNNGGAHTFDVAPDHYAKPIGAPKGELRLSLEAMKPGESKTFSTTSHSMANIYRQIANVQESLGVVFTRTVDKASQAVKVTRVDGLPMDSYQAAPRGRPPRFDFSHLGIGDVMFIEDPTASLRVVREASLVYRRRTGQRHRVTESSYDHAIEVQRLHDNSNIIDFDCDRLLAQARVDRVLRLEGIFFTNSTHTGSADGSGIGSTPNYDGAELFAGQIDDILQILPPGQTVTIGGVPLTKLQSRADYWRKRRDLAKAVVQGMTVRFE